MKNILLSVVVISTLVVAGVGGTLADFSDTEEELGDTIQAGSMDLKVNGGDDPDVLPIILRGVKPDKPLDFTKTVKNMGTIDGHLYIHLKNAVTTETNDKDINGDGVIDGNDMPEPEDVAENGGKVGQMMVDGCGQLNMQDHLRVEIWYGPVATWDDDKVEIDLSSYDVNEDGHVKLNELICNQMYMGMLPLCGVEYKVNMVVLLQDVLDPGFVDSGGSYKFEYWPTNAMQGDTLTFDMLFELLQTDYTPPGG